MDLLISNDPRQWLLMGVSVGLVSLLYQCLPFRFRRNTGLVQVGVVLALGYGGFYGVDQLMTKEHWSFMVVRSPLHLRVCSATYCESLALIDVGEVVEADLNHIQGDWAAARYQGQSGFISTLWAERYVSAE